MRLLVTRPEPDGEHTAALLRARGHDAVLAPLTRIETLAADIAEKPWGAVLITSANAARAVSGHPALARLAPLPVFAVGDRSAAAAREAGFSHVTSAAGDVEALAALVAGRLGRRDRPMLYLAGADRAGDLADVLARHGHAVDVAVVYRARAVAEFGSAVSRDLAAGRIDAALHYSTRSAGLLLSAAQAAGISDNTLAMQHFCLSTGIAAPLLAAGATAVHVAARPDEAALIALVGMA